MAGMSRALIPVLASLAFAGCDDDRGSRAVPMFTLTSAGFRDGQPIPAQYSCDGANRSPPVAWGEPPHGTKSFALVVDDPDAPGGTFYHWGDSDIAVSTRGISAGQIVGSQAINDFGKPGYSGPCPPPGHGPHHYRFKLFALDVPSLGLQPDVKIGELERQAEQHVVGRAELSGTYERR
jgi:Raf kinase inhibitor-like YbhB/YbcL family protein